nr:hypothetical protein [Nitrosomonas nitrosa]
MDEFGEYDLENDSYQPSVDVESSWLTYAVQTARAAIEDESDAIKDQNEGEMAQSLEGDCAI